MHGLGSLKAIVIRLVIYILNRLPIQRNKIFFMSYYGAQYGCNPKYITEYILKHVPEGKFDVVWAFNDMKSKEHLTGFRKVKTMSFKYFYELCTSKVIITNFRTTDLFVKRKDQYYIQTWHSSLRLKQIEKDAENALPSHYVQMAKKDSRKLDLLISGCQYSTEIFKRSFWYDGNIFEHGTPRNDALFQQSDRVKEKVRKTFNITENQKVVLYAPTFRKDNNLEVYDLDYSNVLEGLRNRFDGDWVFLVRLHPHLLSISDKLPHDENVVNVTSYDDIQELLNITDVFITDYSSPMFDFAITGKPCFLYAPDMEDYISQERKLYFDLMDLPFISARSNQDLLNGIEHFDFNVYKNGLSELFKKIGSFENGKASKHLVEHFEKVCFGKNKRGRTYEAV